MEVEFGALAVQFIIFFALPVAVVVISKRVEGLEKLLWALGTLLTSWLGVLLFLLLTSRKTNSLQH